MSNTTILKTATASSDVEARLFAVAGKIQDWQTARGMSQKKLVRMYGALGSEKTLAKLAAGDSESLKVADWLPKYEGVWSLIERSMTQREDETWEDLGPTFAVLRLVPALMTHVGLNRLAIIEGESGSGKSRALKAAAARHPGTVILMEADESWKVPKAMVTALLVAVGEAATVESVTGDFSQRQARLIEALRVRRVLVAIDESQHMTGQGLTVLKTLLNKTEAAYIIAGQATLWRKLQASAWEEAKQLRFNRCFESLTFGAPAEEDVELMVTRRAGAAGVGKLQAATWKLLTDFAGKYGAFAFLRDVVDLARLQVPEGEALGDVELVNAAESIKRRAGTR